MVVQRQPLRSLVFPQLLLAHNRLLNSEGSLTWENFKSVLLTAAPLDFG